MHQPPFPRDLRHSLAAARDEQIARVVATVDALADRGPADDLIAPLRPRLAQLHLRRPLRFSRLLFLPLDPIIVPPARWRPGQALVPRSAITPVAAAVQGALACAPEVERLLAGRSVGDGAVEAAAGALLWAPAAGAVAALASCPGWREATGLPESAWTEVRTLISGVLRVADRITGADAPAFASEDALASVLDDTERHAPAASGAVVSVLLARDPRPQRVLGAVSRCSACLVAAGAAAADRALAALPTTIESGISRADLAGATGTASRVQALLQALEDARPLERARLRAARADAAAACAERFGHGIADELLGPLSALVAPPSDAESIAAEDTARALRRLEEAGRALGADAAYDRALDVAWSRLTGAGPENLDRADRIRVAEILFGPERAAVLLSR